MGKKVNPRGFRLSSIFSWDSKWFAKKAEFRKHLQLDVQIKDYLKKELKDSGIARIGVEKTANNLIINVYAAKPGVLIGRGGAGIDELKKKIKQKFFASQKVNLEINTLEVPKQALNSTLLVQSIAADLEKRVPFRKVMKQSIAKVERAGGLGIKIAVSGRLNGAEIARREVLLSGSIPLQTLRANIDYAEGTARTMYGAIGIKVWIYKGDVFSGHEEKSRQAREMREPREGRDSRERRPAQRRAPRVNREAAAK